jgi:hypothetical protein
MNLLLAVVLVSAQFVGTTSRYYVIEAELANNPVTAQPMQLRFNAGPSPDQMVIVSNTWTTPGQDRVTIFVNRESSPRFVTLWVGECCVPPVDALTVEAVAPPRRRVVSH